MAGNVNSGRKSDWEIITKFVNAELANKIANKELKRIDENDKATLDELKTVVMPIALKGMVEKKEINGEVNVQLINYGDNPNTIPVSTEELPTATPESKG